MKHLMGLRKHLMGLRKHLMVKYLLQKGKQPQSSVNYDYDRFFTLT